LTGSGVRPYTRRMPPRSQLLQDRSLRSRSALVDAATELWRDRTVDDVKVAEICVAAGASKGLFYFYFDSRDALAAELLADDADVVADAVDVAIDARATFDELLRTAVTTLGRRAQRRPRHVLAVAIPEWVRADLAADSQGGLHVPLADTFARIVEFGRRPRRGSPTVPESVDASEAGQLLADAAVLAVHQWAVHDRRQPSLARRLSGRIDLVVHGLTR
jgi:AcrR family transcriptional regulator